MLSLNERIALFKSIPNGVYRPASDTYMAIMDVIEHHVSFEEKTKKGIEHFAMKDHPLYGNRGIYIVHPDGTETDISFRKGYPGKDGVRNHERVRRRAVFRAAVSKPCADFDDVMDEFVRTFGEPPHGLEDNGDKGRKFAAADDDYRSKWVAFHDEKTSAL